MKKKLMIIMLCFTVIIATTLGLVACDNPSSGQNTKPTYTISFYVNGNVYATVQTAGNETITLPNTPTNGNLLFSGWFFDENVWQNQLTSSTYEATPLTQDVSVYARWTTKTITVTYVTNGGSSLPPTVINEGESVPFSVTLPQNDSLIFAGWHLKEDLSDAPVTSPYYPTSDVTLYADWAENEVFVDGYTLKYQYSETGTSPNGYQVRSYNANYSESNTLTFPSNYKSIPVVAISASLFERGFSNDFTEKITTVIIPENIEYIGSKAFWSLTKINTLILGKDVKFIGEAAFQRCWELQNITFGDSLEHVGSSAFQYDRGWFASQPDGPIYMDKVLVYYKGTVPSTVEVREGTVSVGANVFSNKKDLTRITLPNSVQEIDRNAFQKTSITEIELPTNLQRIGENAFEGSKLRSISFPANFAYDEDHLIWKYNLYHLGDAAFKDCTDLTTVELSNIYDTSYNMFNGCTSLNKITIPASVKNIKNSFANSGLTEITILSEEPVYFDINNRTETLQKIIVPKGVKAKIESSTLWEDELKSLVVEMN